MRYRVDSEYGRYLQSNSWKEKRTQALIYYGHKCSCCGSTTRLEVHHLHYKRIYRERMEDLAVVCSNCHKDIHGKWARIGNPTKRERKQELWLERRALYHQQRNQRRRHQDRARPWSLRWELPETETRERFLMLLWKD